MAVDVIDGTVGEAVVKKAGNKVTIYKEVAFKLADGSSRRLENLAVNPAVAAMLEPGTEGRFYGYKAIDHRGLFGARTNEGRSNFIVPSGNEKIMLFMGIAGWVWLAITILVRDSITFLGLALGILGIIGFVRYRSTRLEARKLYDADSGFGGGAG